MFRIPVPRVAAALLAVAALPLASPPVRAACSPAQPHYRYVGDTAQDSRCTDDTIQSAIDHACPDATIYVTNQRTWLQQHLSIVDKSLTLAGTTAACGQSACDDGQCDSTPSAPVVTLYGTTTVASSVVDIGGNSHVTLKYLAITGANTNAYGGGINFDGDGSLTLDTTYVSNNAASWGGGIRINGASAATLTLLAHTHITNNRGGTMGGGIAVVGPATADIASPGPSDEIGAIFGNKAQYGGGITISGAHIEDQGRVNLFSADARRPLRVQGNTALVGGGAIALQVPGRLCARNVRIDGNHAPTGSAVYSDGPNLIEINDCAVPDTAVACAPGAACNEISNNWAMDADGNNTDGAAIYLAPYSVMSASRVVLRSNHGGHVVRASGDGVVQLTNSLITANTTMYEPLSSVAHLWVFDSTLAGNTILADSIVHVGGENSYKLDGDILWQPGKRSLDYAGDPSQLQIDYVLASETGSLVHGKHPHLYGGDPVFADVSRGNYRLGAGSPALDIAPASVGVDLDGLPRTVDLPNADVDGPRDLGAYERQINYSACAVVADTVYCNGFDAPLAR